ncbi:MAG: cysteine desulfurase family protein [Cellulosilyticaceae bacterium]
MTKEIYLDHAATTKPHKTVIDCVAKTMNDIYGNPSSLHKKGIEAENTLKEAADYFGKTLGCTKEEIIFTSGGTESNNTAILGAAFAHQRRGKKIITTPIEHASVKEVLTYLGNQDFEICVVPVDENGVIDLDVLKQEINEQTILVTMMHVNNEISSIEPIEAIGKMIKQCNEKTLFHVDAVQSYTKIPIQVKKSKIDLLSISSHKFYGPRGVGILYKNKDARITNLMYGGGQQKNLRSGTENVPGVAGMYCAAKQAFENYKDHTEHYSNCKKYLYEQIMARIPDVTLNGPAVSEGAPHILNIAFADVRAEVLLHTLEMKNIFVSSGSACSNNNKTQSTLGAIGRSGQALDNAIRFSFGIDNTLEDLEYVVTTLEKELPMLRKYKLGGKK